MIDFVNRIDEYTEDFINDHYDLYTKKLFGFTELVTKKDQPFPVVINGTSDRSQVQVSLDDRFDIITWVRLPGTIAVEEDEEDQWGIRQHRKQAIGLRWIIAHKVELGEDLILKLIESVPAIFNNMAGYQFVVSEVSSVDADHEAIYATELGATVYEKHRFNWNLYAIELNVEFIVCISNTSP